jgi:Mrp family chromosome partitioning ATPase
MVRLREDYDVVVIDAPPLLPVTDAALLSAQTDGALLVVRHGKTSKDQLRHAVDRLEHVGARPLGVVLNMIPSRRLGDPYYGYGYGYGYGYAPETGRRRGNDKPANAPAAGTRRAGGTLEDIGLSRD